jgi:hypothetical protein
MSRLQRGLFILGLILLGLLGLSGNVAAQGEAFLFGIGLMVVLACTIVMVIIAILVGIWMYRDANSRGMNGLLWLILLVVATLIGHILGFIIIFIIYIVVRTDHPVYPAAYPPPGHRGYPPPR